MLSTIRDFEHIRRFFGCLVLLTVALLFSGCAQGSRVASGHRYQPVPKEYVQVLFTAPNRPYREIGLAMAQGAQLATDATAIEEVRSQAAKLGADAVIISGMERRAYGHMPGFVNVNQRTYGAGNIYGGRFSGYANTQTTGLVTGPTTFSGTHVTGVAIKFVAAREAQEIQQYEYDEE